MKMNKFNNTIILLVILLALGGATWWLLSTQEMAVKEKLVFSIDRDTIQSFEISRTDDKGKPMQVLTQLDEKENTWWIKEPVKDEMGSMSLEMLSAFEEFYAEDTIKEYNDLAEFGLDKPAITVMVNRKKDKPLKLLIGAETALPNKYYAKFDHKPEIYVVDGVLKTRFSQEIRFYRQNAVATLDKDKIHEIRIKNKDKAGYIEYVVKSVKGKWTLVKPFAEQIMNDKPDQILNSLPTIFAQEFIDDVKNLGKYGLDEPEYQVDLVYDDGKIVTVKASKVKDNYYFMNSTRPTIFQVIGTENVDFMNFNLPYQFERRLVEYEEKDAKSIEYTDADNKTTIFKGEDFKNFWSFASTLMASQFYHAKEGDIIPLTVSQFEDLKVKPTCRVTYNLKRKNPDKIVLTFYPCDKKDTALVTSNIRSYVYEFPKIDVDTLNTKADEIIKAKSKDKDKDKKSK